MITDNSDIAIHNGVVGLDIPSEKKLEDTAMAALSRLSRLLRPDPYILAILGTVLLASLLPAEGTAAPVMGDITRGAIMLLFFLYGGRLSREAVLAGISNWRLQIAVLLSTFVLFPLLGLLLSLALRPVLPQPLLLGLIFLATLPSTVQSSIAFTAVARGNVPAALCSASLSNLLGVVVTPLLVALLLSAHSGVSLEAVENIVVQLLLPFLAGQLLHRRIGNWLARHRQALGLVDRGSILLVVYTAFSAAVAGGLWQRFDLLDLAEVIGADLVLLGLVLAITTFAARRLGFGKEDEIALVFCGSKKSLASGLPIASVLFAGPAIGFMVLPLMLFHQVQLMACALLANRYARRSEARVTTPAAAPPSPA